MVVFVSLIFRFKNKIDDYLRFHVAFHNNNQVVPLLPFLKLNVMTRSSVNLALQDLLP